MTKKERMFLVDGLKKLAPRGAGRAGVLWKGVRPRAETGPSAVEPRPSLP